MRYKIVLLFFVILICYSQILCSCSDDYRYKYCNSHTDRDKVKFFDVSVSLAPEVETFSLIKEHVKAIREYIECSDELNITSSIQYNDTSYQIEDEIMFMESFISFSSQSNMTTPFSTNGVTIDTISEEVNNCKLTNLLEVSSDGMEESIRNHLITKVIPEFDHINRTITVIPWNMINNTINNLIPEIQRISYKLSLICTSIGMNIDLIKHYSSNRDVKKSQWEALQMASLSRGYFRYIIETLPLAASLILISPKSKDDFSFISGMEMNLSLEYPKKLIDKLKYGNIGVKNNFNCIDFFRDNDTKKTCVVCSTLFLTLFSRLQCYFLETGVSREVILGVRLIEEIHSHIDQLYTYVLSIWNGYYYKLHKNSSHYIPPKPFISWKALKLRLYDQFRIIMNFHKKVEQSSTLDLNINSLFSKKKKKDTEINNYIELKVMDSISNLDGLKNDELETIEKITDTYNKIVSASEYSPKDILFGSNNKLSNSLNAVSIIIGAFVDDEFINFAIENIKEIKYDISSKECGRLHREINYTDSQHSKFIEVFNKYLYCKYKLDIQIAHQFSLKNKFEIIKRALRKITISSRNLLFEKLRERKNKIKVNGFSGFQVSFIKLLLQFQIILGMTKIIKTKLRMVSRNLSGLIPEIEYCVSSLEKFKMKLASHIFNGEHYYRIKGINKDKNNATYLLSPLITSIGPSIIDSTGDHLKKTIDELRYKISLLDKFVTLSRNILLGRRNILQNSANNQDKNLQVYSTALRIYDNKDELYVASEFIKVVYRTLKKIIRTLTKPLSVSKNEMDSNFIDFGINGSCNYKNDVFSLKNSEYLGCRLYVKMTEMIQVDELYTLIHKQIIKTDNTERKIYFEISGLFDEMWSDFEVKGQKLNFKRLSSKLYLLKSLLENVIIFNGVLKNSLVPYTHGTYNFSSLFDFLVGNIEAIEDSTKEIPIIYLRQKLKMRLRKMGLFIKAIFVRKERIKREQRKSIEREIKKLRNILLGLEPHVINIDISFKVNIENLNFIKIESMNRIKKLFYLYIHCIYSTLTKIISTGKVSKHITSEVGDEWNNFIQQLEVVKNSILNQLKAILVSFYFITSQLIITTFEATFYSEFRD
ncbi:hypothetical protein FG386_000728 [Cryptosporidium ryanae]|uniref:uncharacterized protein n=1 Tax=Cryptosporidium ryanae TaxID=515981 RepID=UPI00351A238A|nr:hypothetical protein FG386_000728 [Cryptosporidium ryanae]